MGHTPRQNPSTVTLRLLNLFCLVVLLGVFAMVVPFWVALSAGIAATSALLFGSAVVILSVLLIAFWQRHKLYLSIALVVALFGLIVPQVAFIGTASSRGMTLSFNPVAYSTFSGTTRQSPTRLIPYKQVGDRNLSLAYYESLKGGVRPVVVILHGGAWRYGSHTEIGEWPRLLNEHGYDVASVEYRLANDQTPTWNQSPSDVHDALMYVREHAEELGVDPSQIHLFGQSAGGHLALLEAYRYQSVRSIVSLYAPVDLELDYQTSRDKSAELDFIGGPPAQYAERYRGLSPLTYVTSSAPPTLIIQGKRDDLVATENALELSKRLTAVRADHDLILLPLTGHSFENQQGGFATQIAERAVLDFLQ